MKGEGKKRLTAQRKLELYMETRQKDANLGEILRRHGLHLNDLRRIEAVIERAALEALKIRRNRNGPAAAGTGEYDALVEELARKDQALSELTVEYTLLKKSERLGSKGRSARFMSTATGVRR